MHSKTQASRFEGAIAATQSARTLLEQFTMTDSGTIHTDSIRLATYNIHACIGNDNAFDPARIARVLRELDADVIALQEVEHHIVEDFDLLDYLAHQTGMTAIAGPTLQRESRHYGNALLTHRPIQSIQRLDLSTKNCEPRGAIAAMLDWNGHRIQLVATHLGLRPWERRQQLRRLLDLFVAGGADYSVLLGDLNEWLLWGRPLRWLRQQFAPTPHLRTYPARFPIFALDRIWVHPRLACGGINLHNSPLARLASDHLPLVATLVRIEETSL